MKQMKTAKFIKEITITDPNTKGDVQISVYKHENNGFFAIDSSYLDQCTDEDSYPVIPDPFAYDEVYDGNPDEPIETRNVVMLVD